MLMGHTVADPDGRLLAADRTVCEILQRSAREIVGVSYADLTHPDDRTRSMDYVERLGLFDGALKIRKRYILPDGGTVDTDVRASRLTANGITRLVGTIRVLDPQAAPREPRGLWRSARRALATMRQRRSELGEDLFADHAWLILLQLYLAEAEGRMIDIAALGEGADVRIAIVERWLRALEQKGLIDRLADWPGCAGQLTPAGIARIERLLDHDDGE